MAQLQVLTVCTGNIWRSPLMAALLAVSFGEAILATSAGTHPVAGAPIAAGFADLLAADGLPVPTHRARGLTAALVRDADIVVTATADHRAAVVERVPRAMRRVCTLGELAAASTLLPAPDSSLGPADRLRELVGATPRVRPRLVGRQLDVLDPQADPDGRAASVYRDIRNKVAELGRYCGVS